MGYRGYVTLIARRDDGFVFSGEQLALVVQFQSEELAALEEYKENYYCSVVVSFIFFYFSNIKSKKSNK